MGILTTEQQAYYDNTLPDFGNYRFLSLQDIIDSFMATYVGSGKICENVLKQDVTFHAIRALQELSYDTLRSVKDWEVEVPPSLLLVMPLDYVNYVKLSWSGTSGKERILYPISKTSNPFDITPEVESHGGFSTEENTDIAGDNDSDTWTNYKTSTEATEANGPSDSDEVDHYGGARYGLDPESAQKNGSFFIDESQGKFHFSSDMAGRTLILKYISDGVVTINDAGSFSLSLTTSWVPKMAEEAIYKHILYGTLLARKDTPGGLMAQIKREKFAETRKAKLRLSNIKLEELTQVLRGQSKIIKH